MSSQIIRALYNRNYRIFFAGQGLSIIGTWMQNIALSWLIYCLTDSAFMLGLVAFIGQIPNFVLAPFAGVWIDRLGKRGVLIGTQAFSLLQASLLTWLTLTNRIEIDHILALSLLLGCINAVDVPARNAISVEMMDNQEERQNAIALNSVTYNLARLVGPAMGGILIPLVGEGYCFLLNAASYFVSIISLVALRLKANTAMQQHNNMLLQFKEGYAYTFKQLPLRNILLLLGIISVTAMPYTVLLPVFVTQNLGGNAGTLGFLLAVAGCGSFLAALFIASRSEFQGLEKLLVVAAVIIGISLISFILPGNLWLSAILMFLLGIGFLIQVVGSNTLLQCMVDDSMRGRVMSFYTMIVMGVGPIGSLLAGSLASQIGVVYTLVLGGVCSLAGAWYFARHLSVFRIQACPIYVQSGSLASREECRF
ncbi:MFS transporter [Sporomusa sphaeroides DSM 2875]|uniref:MFS transporter n=1 Tax=Sporomusa sphaeroides TaxID=47679 RepID=UPI00202EA33F|nr:MFS transporter [Sporomusa sphaeroides]MCM0760823.1 MFS transporter [Sporomusa sphaeroides DSM 2875]